jgi:hypothetical protein
MDWFVTSIHDPNGVVEGGWGDSGNRLYENNGDGTFVDVTDVAGVREGFWGWGACFADFNNDGHLDIFHVNGWRDALAFEFIADPSRLFINNGDGTFAERSADLGIVDTGQGRGVVCFDYDKDGDVDIAVFNNGGYVRLYRNDLPPVRHYLAVTLRGSGLNTQAIGARVTATTGSLTQTREIRAGNNFISQNPALAHFGLHAATVVDTLTVRWPDQTTTTLTNVAADQYLHIVQP